MKKKPFILPVFRLIFINCDSLNFAWAINQNCLPKYNNFDYMKSTKEKHDHKTLATFHKHLGKETF